MPEFASILDMPAADISRPAPAPAGSYLCVVNGLPRFDKSTKKQTEYAEFSLKPLQAGEEVDKDELEAWGPLSDKEFKHTFYITERSVYRLKEFMVNDLGIEEEGSLRAMIDSTPGCQCLVHIKHVASEDGTAIYANVAKTAPAE